MDLKINIATRIIILSVLGYILVRLLITFIYTAFAPGKKKRKYDLDQLIRNKEELMRSQSGLKSSTQTPESGENYKFSEERVYCQKLKQLNPSSDKEQFLDIQGILEIFDAAKWGQGPAFSLLAAKFLSQTKLTLDQSTLAKSINRLSQQGLFLKLNSQKLPELKQVQQLILSHSLLEIARDELSKEQSPSLEKLARQGLISVSCLKKAIKEYLQRDQDQLYFTEKRKEIITPVAHLKYWHERGLIFEALIPLKAPPKGDYAAICATLGVPHNAGQDIIKKKYKSLASQMHPDRMGHLKLNAEEIKTLNHNFSIIQDCYEQLKKRS